MSTKTRNVLTRSVEKVQDSVLEYSYTILVVALILLGWETLPPTINRMVRASLPTFSEAMRQTFIVNRGIVAQGLVTTLTEVVVGFTFSVFFGIVLGIVFAESYVIRQSTLPAVVFAYSIPHAIVAPLFIVWFGTGLLSVGLFAAWFGFFTVFVNTITGLNQVDEEFLRLGEVFGASEWQMLTRIKLWAALPHISGGIKVAVQQTIIGVIIAEFIATGQGLGWLILKGQKFFNEALMFGVILLLMIVAILIFRLVSVSIDYLTPGSGIDEH